MRRRTLIEGVILLVVVGLLVDHGGQIGSELPQLALLGVLLGAVVALVPHRSPAGRAGAFAVGFLAAFVGYTMRAGFLPAIPLGRAIAAMAVVALITAVAVVSADRLPLWAGLIGAGTMVGAYEATFRATPTEFTTQSVATATTVLLAAGIGFVALSLLPEPSTETVTEVRTARPAGDPDNPDGAPTERVGVDLFKPKTSEA